MLLNNKQENTQVQVIIKPMKEVIKPLMIIIKHIRMNQNKMIQKNMSKSRIIQN
jgi:hypothetical protein